jgi:hypothetical protein
VKGKDVVMIMRNKKTGEILSGYDYNVRMARAVVDNIKNLSAFNEWLDLVEDCGIRNEDDKNLFEAWVMCCKNSVIMFEATEWEQIECKVEL